MIINVENSFLDSQALPAAQTSDEEGDGKNIKLIPHILSIHHQPLTKRLTAHNECLGVKENKGN